MCILQPFLLSFSVRAVNLIGFYLAAPNHKRNALRVLGRRATWGCGPESDVTKAPPEKASFMTPNYVRVKLGSLIASRRGGFHSGSCFLRTCR